MNDETKLNQRLPLWVCKHCGHEWNDENRYYCGCGGPYRIPNPELRDEGSGKEVLNHEIYRQAMENVSTSEPFSIQAAPNPSDSQKLDEAYASRLCSITWNEKEGIYVAIIVGLPGVVGHGATRQEALEYVEDAEITYIEAAKEHGWKLPWPITEQPS